MQIILVSAILFGLVISSNGFNYGYGYAPFEDNEIEQNDFRLPSYKWINRCTPNDCLVVGMQRYSEPRCEPLGGFNDTCRMYAEPEDKILVYPNMLLEVEQVWTQVCGCKPGLTCQEGECKPERKVPLRKAGGYYMFAAPRN